MMHLSRLSEEIIIWSSDEFGFVRLPDDFATGSSIMPQKRNADIAELTRGRTGRVYGNLVADPHDLKGLPLSYNRDLQEDKKALFDTVDTVIPRSTSWPRWCRVLELDPGRTLDAGAARGYTLATDVADYLVRKGVPFRDAHRAVAELVQFAQR